MSGEPADTTLVLLHGFTGSSASWDDVACDLAVPSVAIDLPGHGTSPAVAPTWKDNIDRVAVSVDITVGGELHLVGYSMGARVALALALSDRLRDRVVALTLIGVHPGLGDDAERSARRSADRDWAERIRSGGVEAFVDAWEALPLWHSQAAVSAEARAAQRAIRLAHSVDGLASSMDILGLGNMPALADELVARGPATRLVTGDGDAKFGSIARDLAERAEHIEHIELAGAGHNVVLEAPNGVRSVLESTQMPRFRAPRDPE